MESCAEGDDAGQVDQGGAPSPEEEIAIPGMREGRESGKEEEEGPDLRHEERPNEPVGRARGQRGHRRGSRVSATPPITRRARSTWAAAASACPGATGSA